MSSYLRRLFPWAFQFDGELYHRRAPSRVASRRAARPCFSRTLPSSQLWPSSGFLQRSSPHFENNHFQIENRPASCRATTAAAATSSARVAYPTSPRLATAAGRPACSLAPTVRHPTGIPVSKRADILPVGNPAPSEGMEGVTLTSRHAPRPPPPPPANQQGQGSPEGSANQRTYLAPGIGGPPATVTAPATASQQESGNSTGQPSADWMDSGLPMAERAQAFQAWQAERAAAWQAWQEAGAPPCPQCNGDHPPPCLDEEEKKSIQARKTTGRKVLKSFQAQQEGAESKASAPKKAPKNAPKNSPKNTGPKRNLCPKCAHPHTGECHTPKCRQCHNYHGPRLTCFDAAQTRQKAGLPPVAPAQPTAVSDQLMFRDAFREVHRTGSKAAMAAMTDMFVATMESHAPSSKSSVPVRGKKRQRDDDDEDEDKGKGKKPRGPPP